MLNTTRATCQYGPARMKRGTMSPHGLKVRIEAEMVDKSKGSARAEVAALRNVALDVSGDIYGALPPGAESIANFALPVKLAARGTTLISKPAHPRKAHCARE